MIQNLSFKNILALTAISFIHQNTCGQTSITKWPMDKKGAVSITYDDGIPTQFTQAIPIMNRLHFPGTFFIVTGVIPGSHHSSKFVGRPVKEIMNETKTIATNKENFFERASAVKFLGYKGTAGYFFKAGSLYESGKHNDAYKTIDSAYTSALSGALKRGIDTSSEAGLSAQNTWNEFKSYAAQGHEFAAHSLSHPFMAILDTPNIHFELQKCKEDIGNFLGKEHTFSAEVPFGTEDSRVIKYVLQTKLFEALRNEMPEPYMQEINRGYKEQPGETKSEYVQWQRGPLTNTPISLMKSWIDTVATHENIWLVLVFHGIDNVGWQPLSHQEVDEYFTYIKNKESNLWVATFRDVTKYMRERMTAKINVVKNKNKIMITLRHPLDPTVYNFPMTLKTYIPSSWEKIIFHQNSYTKQLPIFNDAKGSYALYDAMPNMGKIELSGK